MRVLLETHPVFAEHDARPGHPARPDRLTGSAALAPAGRCVALLEGGYDLDALTGSAAACVGALAGIDHRPELPTTGGPGLDVVEAAQRLHAG